MNSRFTADAATEKQTSWLPMVAIAMGQAQMSWNINALPVSIGGISAEFGTASTTVVSAIVAYSLGVAGFTMFGAKLGQKHGATTAFRWSTALLLLASALTAFSPSFGLLLAARDPTLTQLGDLPPEFRNLLGK